MAKNFSSIAKITKPNLSHVLPRERLFSLLDEGRRFPVTWVSGPGGSGKTTLIASWIDAKKLPCLWYHLDEDDSDIATFFYYLGLAKLKVWRVENLMSPCGMDRFAQGACSKGTDDAAQRKEAHMNSKRNHLIPKRFDKHVIPVRSI